MPAVLVERAQNPAHGDYSVTLPLKLTRTLHRPPMAIATELSTAMALPPSLGRVALAAPGFINITLEPAWLQAQLAPIAEARERWGRSDVGQRTRVQVEFVSSNPTGPMLFSHARGAVVGDVVARVLDAAGFGVQREYYINDKGRQVRLFGESIAARMQDLPVPEGGYSGSYIDELAREAATKGLTAEPTALAEFGMTWVQQRITDDLSRLSVRHDNFFSESSLYTGWDQDTMRKLRDLGRIEEKDGAIWFKTDGEKNEVLIKRDGYPTYFWSDILYFFLLRSADAQMEFDVELARRQSSENPVYYAQYAHARLANVLKLGGEVAGPIALERLSSQWELELMRVMLRWPDVVRESAEAFEPHRLAFFTDELAAAIHRFYKNCRVVTDDAPLTAARLLLSRAARVTIANALGLMGVSAPDRM